MHHARADQAYSVLKEDTAIATINQNIIVLCVDMQQVLFCPTLTHSSMFYQRQLSCYNFAIHNTGNNTVNMNLWNESIARKGSAEITSALLKHITDRYSQLEQGQERKLIVWSDRCVGQNNNWKHVALYSYLVAQRYFSEINQKFLCTGHSFLPCDRYFAHIERKKRVSQVMVPSQWSDVIAEAVRNHPFNVTTLTQSDFKDFSGIEDALKRTSKLKITEVMWLKFSHDDPFTVSVCASHNLLRPWERHEILKQPKRNSNHAAFPKAFHASPASLPQLNTALIPIKKQKKDDLMDMTQYLPPEYCSFYENLPSE